MIHTRMINVLCHNYIWQSLIWTKKIKTSLSDRDGNHKHKAEEREEAVGKGGASYPEFFDYPP